ADLYIERVDADGYWYDGKKLPFETRTEEFTVAGGDTTEIEVKETLHGPIVSGLTPDFTRIAAEPEFDGAQSLTNLPNPGEFAVSLRGTALDVTSSAEAIFLMNSASDYDDFRHAASKF